MRISVKTQLALLFLVTACAIGVITILIVNSIITNQIIYEAQERVKEHLSSARWVYDSKVKDIDRTVYWTSIRHVLKKALMDRNVSALKEELTGIMSQEGFDFLTLVDQKGTVICRFHHPERSGDNVIGDSFIKMSLEQKSVSGTQILTHEELLKEGRDLAKRARMQLVPTPLEKPTEKLEETSGMVLKSAQPVTDFKGRVIGVLTGGVLLNRNYELVDRIKSIVFKEAKYRGKEIGTATIFMGDLRIATNVIDKEGNRAVGTRVMKEVYEQVFEKGLPWVHRAFVVDDWYITAYEPIRDIQGKIVGILYVGMLESKYTVMKEKIILLFFLFSILGMLFALTISFFFSWRMLKNKS